MASDPVPTRRKRGRPRSTGLDDDILLAAEQLISRQGYNATTMEQIAETAGVSKPTVYLRYSSKHELVGSMIDRLELPLPQTLSDDVTQNLLAVLEVQRHWLERHGLSLGAALLIEDEAHPDLRKRYDERVVGPVRDAMRRALRSGIDNGELRRGADAAEIVDALVGAAWAARWLRGRSSRASSRRLIASIVDGLRSSTE